MWQWRQAVSEGRAIVPRLSLSDLKLGISGGPSTHLQEPAIAPLWIFTFTKRVEEEVRPRKPSEFGVARSKFAETVEA